MTQDAPPEARADAPVPTGNARVDAVLERVAQLEDQPVDEHVAGFDAAHDELRLALDEPSAEGPDPGSGPA